MEVPPFASSLDQADARLVELGAVLRSGLMLIALRTLKDPDEARDAVQEILARAIAAVRANRVPPDAPLPAFVYGIARHVLSDVKRSRRQELHSVSSLDIPLPAGQPSPLEALVGQEERDRLRRALSRLSPEERELLTRHYLLGESMVQIADEGGIPPERLRKRKSRALKRLRELMGGRVGHVSGPPPMSVA